MKKIVSLCLIFVMLLSCITAMATSPITITAVQVSGSKVKGTDWDRSGQNSLPNVSGGFEMTSGSWGRYEIEATEEGVYALSANYSSNVDNSNNKLSVISNDMYSCEFVVTKTTSGIAFNSFENLGYIYLKQGANVIKLENTGSSYYIIKSVTLTKVSDSYIDEVKVKNVTVAAKDVTKSGAGETAVKGTDWDRNGASSITLWNSGFEMTNGSWGRYEVNAPVSGTYAIHVKAGNTCGTASNLSFTNENGDKVITSVEHNGDNWGKMINYIGYLPLNAGKNIVIMKNEGPMYYIIHNFTFEKVNELKVESATVTNGGTVSRGTDVFEFTFDQELTSADVTLKEGENDISFEKEISGNTLKVYLTHTLDYEKSYILKILNIATSTETVAPKKEIPYNFTTLSASDTTGTATMEITKSEFDSANGKMVISGIVKSSAGKGISGRTVKIAETAQTVTSEGGAFTLEFPFTEEPGLSTNIATYNCKVITDYAEKDLSIDYITSQYEREILEKFVTAADENAVEAIFTEHYDELSIPTYSADMASLADTDLFYNHFELKTFGSASEFRTYYAKMLSIETLNQSKSASQVKTIIASSEECAKIGIDYNKITSLTTNLDNFVNEYITQSASISESAFLERFNTLLTKWLRTEYGKTDSGLNISNVSVNVGQAVYVPITFATSQSDIKTIDLIVTASDKALLENAVLESENTKTLTVNDTVATVKIEFETLGTGTEFGKLTLTAPSKNTYTLTVKGKVTYSISDNIEIQADIPEKIITVTVSENTASPQRPTAGGGGGGGSWKPATDTEKEPEQNKTEDPEITEENAQEYIYSFNDLEDAKWAESVIISLVEKNIVSRSEDGNFRPHDNVTREEFVKMIVTAIGTHDSTLKSQLTDIPENHWAESYIASAEKQGIITGNELSRFGLGENITRQDMAVIIYRAFLMLGMEVNAQKTDFADEGQISDYAKDAVSVLKTLEIINGMGDGTFAPKENATRAQAAKIIYEMLEVLNI